MVVVGQNILTGCHFGRGSARFQEQLPESDSQTARLRADTVWTQNAALNQGLFIPLQTIEDTLIS